MTEPVNETPTDLTAAGESHVTRLESPDGVGYRLTGGGGGGGSGAPSALCPVHLAPTDPIAALPGPCSSCGHTMTLHPGFHNPGLETCQVCRVEVLLEETQLAVRSWLSRLQSVAPSPTPLEPGEGGGS